MIVLGIESSCDETAIALLDSPQKILANVIATQDTLHAVFGGVVPEIASRRHMEVIVPLLNRALTDAKKNLKEIDAIAVTNAPGLLGSLLVGLSFAKALAYAGNKPLVGVNHLEGHLNAARLENNNIKYPHIGLVVSGGHTSLYLVKDFGKYKLLGATRDDAAGEAFDKVAKLLGLGYPGGPLVDGLAKNGDPKAFRFTKPKLNRGSTFEKGEFDFSFSGLKTAVMLEMKRHDLTKILPQHKADIAASFQRTVVDIIVQQILTSCKKYRCSVATISGGVAANSELRTSLEKATLENGIKLYLPSIPFCTDNAAMIAFVGAKKFELGKKSPLSLSARANEDICI